MSLKSNGQMVGDVEVVTGQVTDCDASGTDQIQGVAFVFPSQCVCVCVLGLSTNIRSSNIRSKCIQKREFEREN